MLAFHRGVGSPVQDQARKCSSRSCLSDLAEGDRWIHSLLRVIALACVALIAGCADMAQIMPIEVKNQPLMGGLFDGTVYRTNGKPVEGKLRFSDGTVHEGTFGDSKLEYGRILYPDGRVLKGTFASTTGWGTMDYPNGEVMAGAFVAGRAEGLTLQWKADGTRFYGPFKGGEMAGVGYCFADGKAGMCSRKYGLDNTKEALTARGAERADAIIRDEARTARSQVDDEFKLKLAKKEENLAELRGRETRLDGPTRDDDFNCFCTIREVCLTLNRNDEVVNREKERLQSERRNFECRDKYADWLQIKKTGNLAQLMRNWRAVPQTAPRSSACGKLRSRRKKRCGRKRRRPRLRSVVLHQFVQQIAGAGLF